MNRDIVVIGASAGGVDALLRAIEGLPSDLPAAVFLVLHIPPHSPSTLPTILSKGGPLKALHARDGEPIRPGQIYVAPPDNHLLLESGHVVVRRGPKENRFRPSIDALFRSAAYVYGPRTIGVVLSGVLDDGTSGLWSIKRLGGLTLVQKPEDAQHPEMPRSALEHVEVDHVCPAGEMGPLITSLVGTSAPEVPQDIQEERRRMGRETEIAAREGAFDKGIMEWGNLAPFTCPECHGVLVRLKEGPLLRFRCHTGHAFTPSTLLAGIDEAVEETLWQAMRGVEEQTMMLEHIASHLQHSGRPDRAEFFLEKARRSRRQGQIIHDSLPEHAQSSEDT